MTTKYKVTLWREGQCFGSLDLEDTPEAAEAAGDFWLEKMEYSGKKEFSFKVTSYEEEAPKRNQVFVVTQHSSDTLVVLSSEQNAIDYMNAHVQHICQNYLAPVSDTISACVTPEDARFYNRIVKLPLNEMAATWNRHFVDTNPSRIFRHGPFPVDMHMFNTPKAHIDEEIARWWPLGLIK